LPSSRDEQLRADVVAGDDGEDDGPAARLDDAAKLIDTVTRALDEDVDLAAAGRPISSACRR